MVLHKVRAPHVETAHMVKQFVRLIAIQYGQTVLYSYQSDKLFHHVSYGGTHSTNSVIWGLGWGRKPNGQREEVRERLSGGA